MNWLFATDSIASFFSATGVLAQATSQPAQQAPPWAEFLHGPMPLVIGALILFLFISSRTKRADERKKKELLSSLKRGDRVQTIGGILGKVVEVTKENEVLLKVDESSNTKIWFRRDAIFKVLGEEKDKDKDGKDKPAELPSK